MSEHNDAFARLAEDWGESMADDIKAAIQQQLGGGANTAHSSPEARRAMDVAKAQGQEALETALMFAIMDQDHARRDEIVKQMRPSRPYWQEEDRGTVA